MSQFGYMLGGRHTDPDVAAHLTRLTVRTNARDLTNLILGLKDDGLWEKIEILCVLGKSLADTYLNLRGTAIAPDSSTLSGFPQFTATGVQLASYASSSFTNTITLNYAETDASIYQQYNGHIMLYAYDKPVPLGSEDTMFYNNASTPRTGVGNRGLTLGWNIEPQGRDASTPAVAQAGTLIGTARAITDRESLINDTHATTGISTPYTLRSADFNIGGATSGVDKETFTVSAWGIGSGLTAQELDLYENRIKIYAQAQGFG